MENEILTIKLYTPLSADFWPTDTEYGWEDSIGDDAEEQLNGYDLLQYKDIIAEKLQHENELIDGGDLMRYYDKDDAVKAKAQSAIVSVEPHENQLCGCATVELKQPLEGDELNILMQYLTGQYSDGFGEGFEQREIKVDGGMLYLHLWQPNDFTLSVSTPNTAVPHRPAMKLVGYDGNIYAILGRASRLLRGAGQDMRAKEMTDRVCKSDSYEKALNIISEYVQTELSEPQHTPAEPKNKGNAR